MNDDETSIVVAAAVMALAGITLGVGAYIFHWAGRARRRGL